jgi:hypothetical protein
MMIGVQIIIRLGVGAKVVGVQARGRTVPFPVLTQLDRLTRDNGASHWLLILGHRPSLPGMSGASCRTWL